MPTIELSLLFINCCSLSSGICALAVLPAASIELLSATAIEFLKNARLFKLVILFLLIAGMLGFASLCGYRRKAGFFSESLRATA